MQRLFSEPYPGHIPPWLPYSTPTSSGKGSSSNGVLPIILPAVLVPVGTVIGTGIGLCIYKQRICHFWMQQWGRSRPVEVEAREVRPMCEVTTAPSVSPSPSDSPAELPSGYFNRSSGSLPIPALPKATDRLSSSSISKTPPKAYLTLDNAQT